MKVVKDLALLATGAMLVVVYQRYSADMMQMAKDFLDNKCNCHYEELED